MYWFAFHTCRICKCTISAARFQALLPNSTLPKSLLINARLLASVLAPLRGLSTLCCTVRTLPVDVSLSLARARARSTSVRSSESIVFRFKDFTGGQIVLLDFCRLSVPPWDNDTIMCHCNELLLMTKSSWQYRVVVTPEYFKNSAIRATWRQWHSCSICIPIFLIEQLQHMQMTCLIN